MGDWSHSLLAGFVAGGGAKTITAPLSRTTILQQVGCDASKSANSAIATVRNVVKDEGVFSLWRGNLLSVVHKGPFAAVNYAVYEKSKLSFRDMGFWAKDDEPGVLVRFGSGLMAGGTAVFVSYPIDVMRTRKAATADTNTLDVARDVWRNPLAVYGRGQGLGASVACQGLNLAINFAVYESLLARCLGPDQRRGSLGVSLMCGAIAGTCASSIIHPLDLLRRKQQMCTEPLTTLVPRIYESAGLRGFYRGLGAELCKVAPAVGINFYLYEFVRREFLKGDYAAR